MNYNIAVVPGDGIGPEVIEEAIKVLDSVGAKYGHEFSCTKVLAGGAAIDACGECLPKETLDVCKNSDAVLLGAVGGPKWDNVPGDQRPERALLGLRKEMGLYANLRPAVVFKELKAASPLKPEIIGDGMDILIVRELTGGIYFGSRNTFEASGDAQDEHAKFMFDPTLNDGKPYLGAYDMEYYSEPEIRRIAITAFDMAMKRNKRVTSVDKANVLDSSRLWRKVVTEVAKDYPEVSLDHMYVDNAAMQLIRDPGHFDVIVTSNMFGDILSDEASQITGSIGMLPSASLTTGNFGMYEPVHGSAPDIAGTNTANPLATILSVAMMLRYTLGLSEEANAIENAVEKFLSDGHRTKDIAPEGDAFVGTKETGDLVASLI